MLVVNTTTTIIETVEHDHDIVDTDSMHRSLL